MDELKNGILIWGAGAVGGTVGAHLAKAGHEVTLVDTSVEHIAAIQDNGLSIIGPNENFTIRPSACLPEEVEGRWGLVMLAVKAQHTAAATAVFVKHLAGAGSVLSLQNGLLAEEIADRIGRERTFVALGSVAADVLGPGKIHFGSSTPMAIGQVDGGSSMMLDEIVALMRDFEPRAFAAPDIQNHLWGKHCFNTITSASAAGHSPLAELLDKDELRPLWGGLYREVISVALAEGIEPFPFGPFDPMAFAPDAPTEAGEAFLRTLIERSSGTTKPHSGMWRDIAIHHRETEVAALLEPIGQLGARHGLATPLIEGVVALIQEIETGKRPQDDANLVELLQCHA